MADLTKLRPYGTPPRVDDVDLNQFLIWVHKSLNALVGQTVQVGTAIQALQNPTVDPTTAVLKSAGSRTASLTTNFGFVPAANQITLFWDGTNTSTILRIYRDDGTIVGPFPGSQLITGLNPSTTYFFYPYFDEAAQLVRFVSQAGAVGSPPIAYTAASIAVAQSQILRGRVPLASNLGVTGATTTAAGTGAAASAGGGGGSGGSYLGSKLTQ